jgi:hypothetical protein
MINTPIVLSDKTNTITIKDTLMTGYEAVQFRSKMDQYYSLISSYQAEITGITKDVPEVIFATRKAVLDKKFAEMNATKDDKLRISKKTILDQELEMLLADIDKVEKERMASSDNLLKAMEQNSKMTADTSGITNFHKEAKFKLEIEIVKILCEFLAPEEAKGFDYNKLSLLAPSKLIEEVLHNPENDCNDYFMRWSEIKKQAKVANQS